MKPKNIIKSFSYAFSGIIFCIKNEINFRIHIVASIYCLWLGFCLELENTQFAILFFTIGLVISMEAINTSIETTIDFISPQKNPLAKIAKDTSAGAVLISAIASIFVGIALFFKPQKLYNLLHTIINEPFYILMFIISIIISLCFIFGYYDRHKHRTNS